MIRIGSLFSGYGGLDLAAQQFFGGDLAWYSEIEPAACQILSAHHPITPNLGDITLVDWSTVEPVDVLTGGYPCQPFSHAGKRKGKSDERHLWPFVAVAINALRPSVVVLENVRGHLTLGFGDVLADLHRLGYDARWGVVRAADAGAPHGRARVFIAAYPSRGTGREGTGWGVPESSRAAGLAARDFASPSADASSRSLAGSGATGDRLCQPPQRSNLAPADAQGDEQREPAEPRAVRAESRDGDHRSAADPDSHGHGQQLHPRRVGGVEGEAEGEPRQRERPRRVPDSGGDLPPADADSRRHAGWQVSAADDGRRIEARSEQGTELESSSGDALGGDGSRIDWGKYGAAIHRWEHALGRPAPDPTVPGANGRPRLSPLFVEWMMGLPLGHVTGHGLRPAQELKALGNGVCPQQAHLALRMILGDAS